jgi:hypothetical protein
MPAVRTRRAIAPKVWLAFSALVVTAAAPPTEGRPGAQRELHAAARRALAGDGAAATQLAGLVRGVGPNALEEGAVDELVALLQASDPAARFWAAVALGESEHRGIRAVPALQAALARAGDGTPTSRAACAALRRIDGRLRPGCGAQVVADDGRSVAPPSVPAAPPA